jgi:Fe-S-cluster containining protein
MSEVKDPMEILIKDNTVDGKCSGCGECCSNMLPLSQAEISRIKAYIKKYNIREQRHNFMVGIDMTCPFRDDANKRCTIYPVRPDICKEFVCNHSIEDLYESKTRHHKTKSPTFMRGVFFGSNEELEFVKLSIAGATWEE